MITEILGKVSITPKGQWVAGTYKRLDLVTNAGSSYLSMKDGNISELTVATDWMLVAEKGRAFEYSDFTPAQIAELQRPATDAVIAVNEAEIIRNNAENDRISKEYIREENEFTREQNETAREVAENDRDEAEALRLSAETTRGQNEQARVTAEQARQTNTATAIQNANNAAANVKDGKSAYQIYYDTTTDNPKLTESQWGNLMSGILNVLNSI